MTAVRSARDADASCSRTLATLAEDLVLSIAKADGKQTIACAFAQCKKVLCMMVRLAVTVFLQLI